MIIVLKWPHFPARQHRTAKLLDNGLFHERPEDEDRQRRDGRNEEKQNEEQSIDDGGYQLPLFSDAAAAADVAIVLHVVLNVPGVTYIHTYIYRCIHTYINLYQNDDKPHHSYNTGCAGGRHNMPTPPAS